MILPVILPAIFLSLASGCKEPGTLSAISALDSEAALAEATPALRTGLALTSLTGEICTQDALEGYTFTGIGADTLGITSATVIRDEDGTTHLTFPPVGLDGGLGTLSMDSDAERRSWDVAFTSDGNSYAASILVSACDVSIAISGSGTWTSSTGSSALINLIGESGGVHLDDDGLPISGQARWTLNGADTNILLDPADTVDLSAGGWPGVVAGTGWTFEVEVQYP